MQTDSDAAIVLKMGADLQNRPVRIVVEAVQPDGGGEQCPRGGVRQRAEGHGRYKCMHRAECPCHVSCAFAGSSLCRVVVGDGA
jgi:hypothetical protein